MRKLSALHSRVEHMFGDDAIDSLDAREACEAVEAAHRELVELECRQLRLAAHWIDLHSPEDHPDDEDTRQVLPGTQRFVRSGADGTPLVGEFAAAELAALQQMHAQAGAALLRKVANLRHRHPLLWSRVMAGEVRAWKALETAKIVGRTSSTDPGLDLEQARWVDARTHAWIDTLPWSEYVELLEQTIIAADPAAAESRRLEAALAQGVWATQSSEHGLKTLVAKAAAGEVLYLVAVVDRLAEILAARGDTRDLGPRRASALGILAHPAHALHLLATGTAQGDLPDEAVEDGPEEEASGERSGGVPAGAAGPAERSSDEGGGGESARVEVSASCGAARPGHRASYLDLPEGLARVLGKLDLEKLLPKATLYVHLDQTVLASGGLGAVGTNAATVEGVGAVTVEQVRQWLGHRRVTVQPVLDPTAQASVDSYAFPPRLREALHLSTPRDAFPYAVNTGRGMDIDHPIPYLPPARGGPPGQTGLHNAAPMVRHHHRLKTHGRWRLRQVDHCVYLWTSPHGYHWLTDRTGTRRLPRAVAELVEHGLQAGPAVEGPAA